MFSSALITGMILDCFTIVYKVAFALALANDHLFQTLCSGRRRGDILVNNLRLPALKTNYRELPTVRTITRLTGIDFRGYGAYSLMGYTPHLMVRQLLAGAPSPTPRGDCYASLDRIGSGNSKIERCLKNLELLNEPLDQKLIDFDTEKQKSY